jgi:phage terminase large subunit-like protein
VFRPDAIADHRRVPLGTHVRARLGSRGDEDDGDWTVGVKLGQMSRPTAASSSPTCVRLQGAPDEVEAALVNTAERDGKDVGAHRIPQDPGQAGKAQVAT